MAILKSYRQYWRVAFLIGLAFVLSGVIGIGNASAAEERVRDLADIAGVRSNQLVGYGLVTGLDGTGDQTTQAPFTAQSLRNMLGQLGVTIDPSLSPGCLSRFCY